MFDIINDVYVKLMLSLSSEHINRETVKTSLKEIELHKLYELCVENELDGVVAANIIKYELHDLPSYWIDAYNRNKETLSFLKKEAERLCEVMYDNGIKMVILKNGGIMADIMADPAACPMEDIDSLVKKADFKRAHQIIIDEGFIFKFRSVYEFEHLEEAYRDGSTEYYIKMPNENNMWFELAWRSISGRWIRLDKEPNSDILIDRAYFAKNTKVGILSPEDNLLQVCVHTAKHSYVRAPGLRLHLDVERIVTHKIIDWNLFLEMVRKTHVKTAVYFSLLIPTILFGTEVPQYVLNELRPSKRKEKEILSILKKVGLLYPRKNKFSKLQFLRFQTLLYDTTDDVLKVLNPGLARMREIYDFKSSILLPWFVLLRGLDLVGIRKRKVE